LHNLKTFYGKAIINNNDTEDFNFKEIQLEYYKTKSNIKIGNDLTTYGVKIVKRRQAENTLEIEEKEVSNIANKEKEIDSILKLLVAHKVTPIGLDDVLQDLMLSCLT
jgi:cobalamin biosynthesis Mg chelatase CobN